MCLSHGSFSSSSLPSRASLCWTSTAVGLHSLPRLSVPYSRCFSGGVFVFRPFLCSLFLFLRLSLCFIYPPPQWLFPLTYVTGVTFSVFALVLLRSLSCETHVCNLLVICLCACPYCNFTGRLLVCLSVFPGRVMPSLLASEFSSTFLFFFTVEDFMWVSLIVCIGFFFLSRKAFHFRNVTPEKMDSSADQWPTTI